MRKQMKKTLVPELRFPEFVGSREWKEKELSKFNACELSNGVFNDPKKVGTGYKLINVSDMYIDTAINEKKLNLLNLSKNNFLKNKVENGDIFFTRSSLVKSGIAYSNIYLANSKDITYDGHLIRFRANTKHLIPIFANYLLRTYRVRSQLVARGKTATMTTIGQTDVNGVKLLTPCIEEQQKIADCLSSLDELITLQTQKHTALQAHKKGLMQQLFPAAGEPVPTLRFPEFVGAGEWEEKELGEITDFSSGGTPSKNNPKYWDGNIPWISASSMHNIYIDKSNQHITKYAVDKGASIAQKGTLLLLVRGSMLHKRIPVGIAKLNVAFNQDVKALNLKKNILEHFLLYLLFSCEWRLLNTVTKTGIGAGKLDTNDLKGFLIRFPIDKKEQQKIADCLSSLDDLITAQAQKIESLKTHKKGLMQKLFPVGEG